MPLEIKVVSQRMAQVLFVQVIELKLRWTVEFGSANVALHRIDNCF